MAGFNKWVGMGNIVRDPELRYTPQGTAVTDITVGVNRKMKDKEEVAFIDVTCWDKTAESVVEHLNKGSQVLVEGRLTMDTWQDKKTGDKRSKLKVTADNVQFIGGREVRNNAAQDDMEF